MSEKGTPVESLEAWLSGKPFWEQYVWHLNLKKESLTDEDVEQSYQYLSEYLGLRASSSGKRPVISFKNEIMSIPDSSLGTDKIQLVELKDFVDVNAISPECSIKIGPNLTLIYGGNGSGKSGIGRLLCNACFSRGEREILPNIRTASIPAPKPRATFVLEDKAGTQRNVEYSIGDSIDDLKRFSVFDSKSVLIHLDQSNRVNFTPAQIKIFDKVADLISKLEEKLTNERNAKRKDNPFLSMFLDDATSATALFCKSITGATKDIDFLKQATFDPKVDGDAIKELQRQIDENNKLDIPKKQSQLATDRQNLEALKTTLQGVLNRFTQAKMLEANQLIKDIIEKKKIVEGLSVATFNDGILKTIGSQQWKVLINAAKDLYEKEKEANKGKEPAHCMLCHQNLTTDAESLFQKYWQFLESKAESELTQLNLQHAELLQEMRSAKALHPKFLATDAGVKILNDEDLQYFAQLKVQFNQLGQVHSDWETQIGNLKEVDQSGVPTVDLSRIHEILTAKSAEELKLVNSSGDIEQLTAQLNALKHRKEAAAVKDAALEYISFLNWESKTGAVSFSGIKMATTKKRTESFLVGVAQNYKGVFNQELKKLDCEFDLVMLTSGEQGNTVKEYRLDFAEDYNPSQILSEGEQNACSLADFLTEVQLDKNNCGIIFDDPVTSLDHKRKDKIAARLIEEAEHRQVVVFTHDIVFMSQLVKHADKGSVLVVAHWMRKVNGIPGCIEDNTSPRLTSLASLKSDSMDAVKDFASLGAKEQERALGAAFDYLRSACEALIEEVLFAGTIQRYDDDIKVRKLEEAIFDQVAALKIVDLHGKISEVILAHNRSDHQRENPPGLEELGKLRKSFDALDAELRSSRRDAIKNREVRKKATATEKVGW